MTSFGLSVPVSEKIRAVFQKYEKIQKVIIYGSRAKGHFKPGSDIDLTVVGPDLTMSDLLKLEVELDDLSLPYKIDLSLFHEITDHDLLDHIKRVGLTFYPRSQS